MSQDPSARDPLIGTIFEGKYRIDAVLAVGGMGRVYRAEQIALGRRVAVKVLRPHACEAPGADDFVKRFSREASLLSQLQHPNVVTVYDYGQAPFGPNGEPAVFIVMELLEGETLHARLRRERALAAERVVPVARDVLRGLREVHRRGLVHRDLKPANIMIVPTADGELAKLLDFGLVKPIEAHEELTFAGTFLGSPLYMSPEQMAQQPVDHRADLYALGVLLYECLSGAPPFTGSYSQLVLSHVSRPPPPLVTPAGTRPPAPIDALVLGCLAKEPDERPQSVDEVLAALDAYESGAPELSNRPGFWQGRRAPALPAGPPSSRRPRPAAPDLTAARRAPPSGGQPAAASPWQATTLAVPAGRPSPRAPSAPPPGFVPPGAPPPARAPAGSGPDDQGPPTFASLAKTGRPSRPDLASGRPRRALGVALTGAGLASTALAGVLYVALRAPPPRAADGAGAQAYEVTLRSAPAGALVREGDAVLGNTPLTLVVANEAVRLAPRRLVVELEGHKARSVALEAGSSPRTIALSLEPLPAPAPPASAPAPAEHASAGPKPAHRPKKDAWPKDIRLER
ncbi:MAG TPA: protein kinase [Polyangiaceae bacterium]|nr:protein kinase [Polyangiaceae bacterium]